MKKFLAIAFAIAFATPAFAGECPANMAAIDEALQTASLDAAQMDEVKALRASGEEKHSAGDHAGSMEDLAKAREMLEFKSKYGRDGLTAAPQPHLAGSVTSEDLP